MEIDYIKEKYIPNAPNPITFDILKIILEQKEKSICKIICNNGESGTGFFCSVPFPDKYHLLPVLMTNNHVLEEKDIDCNKKIKFELNDKKISKELMIGKNRRTYTSTEYDITIIEIKNDDGLDLNSFLDIDERIYKDNPNEIFRNTPAYLIYYSNQNAEYSNYFIDSISEDNYNLYHKCSSKHGSSGSPILNLNNNKVIGIHKGSNKEININLGTLLRKPLEQFYKEKDEDNKEKFKNNNGNNLNNILYEVLGENYPTPDLSFKIIKGCNKNCDFFVPTVGFEFLKFIIKINNEIIKLTVWDTCGQEVYRSLISSFYRHSSLAIIVYSIDK